MASPPRASQLTLARMRSNECWTSRAAAPGGLAVKKLRTSWAFSSVLKFSVAKPTIRLMRNPLSETLEDFGPVLLNEPPCGLVAVRVGGDAGDGPNHVLVAYLVGQRERESSLQQALVGSAAQSLEAALAFLAQDGRAVESKHGLMAFFPAPLGHQPVGGGAEVRGQRRAFVRRLVEPAQRLGLDAGVPVAAQLVEYQRAQQACPVVLVGPGIPPAVLVDRLVQMPRVGPQGFVTVAPHQHVLGGAQGVDGLGHTRSRFPWLAGWTEIEGACRGSMAAPRKREGVVQQPGAVGCGEGAGSLVRAVGPQGLREAVQSSSP